MGREAHPMQVAYTSPSHSRMGRVQRVHVVNACRGTFGLEWEQCTRSHSPGCPPDRNQMNAGKQQQKSSPKIT